MAKKTCTDDVITRLEKLASGACARSVDPQHLILTSPLRYFYDTESHLLINLQSPNLQPSQPLPVAHLLAFSVPLYSSSSSPSCAAAAAVLLSS